MAKPKTADPRAIAITAVQAWFNHLTGTVDSVTDSDNRVTLESAFDDVTAALEAEHIAQFGPIEPNDDVVMEMIGRETGYLVGVQVGLRLREKGGQ